MGKFIGIVQYSGKLGNTVGMRKGAGQKYNNVRAMAEVVTNPRTDPQILQRMKCLTCANFYSAFKGVLNHAFQGTKYGSPCQSEFLRLNMRQNVTMPIAKGTKTIVPAPVYVSTGSIPSINYTVGDTGVSISCSSITTRDWGHLSAAIIDKNPYLHDGDQLTVLEICTEDIPGIEDGTNGPTVAEYKRFVLNINSTDAVPSIITYGSGSCTFGVFASDFVAGGAIIVSRPSVFRTRVTWQRSTQKFVINANFRNYLNQNSVINACVETFKKAETVNLTSNWYLNGGTTSSTEGSSSGGESSGSGPQRGGTFATSEMVGRSNTLLYISNGGRYHVVDDVLNPSKVVLAEDIISNTSVQVSYYNIQQGDTIYEPRVSEATLESFGIELFVSERP